MKLVWKNYCSFCNSYFISDEFVIFCSFCESMNLQSNLVLQEEIKGLIETNDMQEFCNKLLNILESEND